MRAKLKLSHITSCQPRAERQKLWAECEVQSLINQQVLPCPSFRQTCQLLCRNTSQSLQQVGLWNNFSLGKCTFYNFSAELFWININKKSYVVWNIMQSMILWFLSYLFWLKLRVVPKWSESVIFCLVPKITVNEHHLVSDIDCSGKCLMLMFLDRLTAVFAVNYVVNLYFT